MWQHAGSGVERGAAVWLKGTALSAAAVMGRTDLRTWVCFVGDNDDVGQSHHDLRGPLCALGLMGSIGAVVLRRCLSFGCKASIIF